MADRDVIQALRAIKALALQHHGDEPPATLLHALLVEIPAECDSAIAALDAAGARPTPPAPRDEVPGEVVLWWDGVNPKVMTFHGGPPCVRYIAVPADARERESAEARELRALLTECRDLFLQGPAFSTLRARIDAALRGGEG